MIYESVRQMTKMLNRLLAFLDAAESHAAEGGYPVDNLLEARLAPDMFPLMRQFQAASDAAKLAVARLSAMDAPKHPDGKATADELRARIRETIAFMESADRAAIEQGMERAFQLPFLAERDIQGIEYFVQFAQPNFYFHTMACYAILRHNGVKLGKADYLSSIDSV